MTELGRLASSGEKAPTRSTRLASELPRRDISACSQGMRLAHRGFGGTSIPIRWTTYVVASQRVNPQTDILNAHPRGRGHVHADERMTAGTQLDGIQTRFEGVWASMQTVAVGLRERLPCAGYR